MNRYRSKNRPFRGASRYSEHFTDDFGVLNLSAQGFAWIHEAYWDDSDKEWVAESIVPTDLQLFKPPSFYRKQGNPNKSAGKWILKSTGNSTKHLLFIEIQVFGSRFSSLWISVFSPKTYLNEETPINLPSAMGLLLSAMFTIYGSDLAMILSNIDAISTSFASSSEAFFKRSIWTLNHQKSQIYPELINIDVDAISRQDWFESDLGKSSKESIAYLEKRIKPPKETKRKYSTAVWGLFRTRPPCC